MNFKNQKVLVTGGARGIGRATAIAFAEAGAQVAINYRSNHEAAQQTLADLPGTGHLLLPADLADPQAIEQMFASLASQWGQLDILVNNAGVYLPHPIEQSDYSSWQTAWQQTLAVNLTGVANTTYWATQLMKKNKGGRIVNVSSRGAFRGEPEHPAYAASKAGLNAMSQSLAQALAPSNIFIGVVAPGFVDTEMAQPVLQGPEGDAIRTQSPLGRVASPEEVAWNILFLASEKSAFNTGAILDLNGASYLRS